MKKYYKNGDRVIIVKPEIEKKILSKLAGGAGAKHFNNHTVYHVITDNSGNYNSSIAVSNVSYKQYSAKSSSPLDYVLLHFQDIRLATPEELSQEINSLIEKVKAISTEDKGRCDKDVI